MNKYQPSNGTEGSCFMGEYCEQCINERWMHHQNEDRNEDKCGILSDTMIYDLTDKEYPNEWIYDKDGIPTCTAWVKWDWGNDDDGFNDPPEPEPYDPNQLCFPWLLDELTENKPQLILNP